MGKLAKRAESGIWERIMRMTKTPRLVDSGDGERLNQKAEADGVRLEEKGVDCSRGGEDSSDQVEWRKRRECQRMARKEEGPIKAVLVRDGPARPLDHSQATLSLGALPRALHFALALPIRRIPPIGSITLSSPS